MLVVPLRFLREPTAQRHLHRGADAVATRGWSTSSFGTSTDTSPLELRDLSDHVDHCHRSTGKFFSVLCLSDGITNFLAPRLVTTLAVIALVAEAVFAAV